MTPKVTEMTCTIPLAVKTKTGIDVLAPCGQCLECRKSKKQHWVGRALMESMGTPSSFLTLTYENDDNPGLEYSVAQKFMKRLRKSGFRGRFVCRAELGETTGRPHFHYLLFGREQEMDGFTTIPQWNYGHVWDAPINSATAGYVFGYNMEFEKEPNAYTRYSTGNGKKGTGPIGYTGWKRIAEIVAKTGYAIAPPTITINGRWYPVGPTGKRYIEKFAIEMGAKEVPEISEYHKGWTSLIERLATFETQARHRKNELRSVLNPSLHTNNRKAAQRGKKISR